MKQKNKKRFTDQGLKYIWLSVMASLGIAIGTLIVFFGVLYMHVYRYSDDFLTSYSHIESSAPVIAETCSNMGISGGAAYTSNLAVPPQSKRTSRKTAQSYLDKVSSDQTSKQYIAECLQAA